jgi:hypothetical protein
MVLQSRIRAAVTSVTSHYPKIQRFAALRLCLGGHSILDILELGRMQIPVMRATMTTFHGVFDGIAPQAKF